MEFVRQHIPRVSRSGTMDTQVNKNLFHGARVTDLRQMLEFTQLRSAAKDCKIGRVPRPPNSTTFQCWSSDESLDEKQVSPGDKELYCSCQTNYIV